MAYIELADIARLSFRGTGLGQAAAEFGSPAGSSKNPYFAALSTAPVPGAISPQAVDAAGAAEAEAMMSALSELKTVASQANQNAARANALLAPKRAKVAALKQTLSQLQVSSSRPGLGDLSGSGGVKFVIGQLGKIDADVRSGRWTDMLVELARITPDANGKGPEDFLKDPVLSAIRTNLETNYKPQDPALLEIARMALSSMASRPPIAWDGQTPAPPTPPVPMPGTQDNAALMTSAKQAAFDPAVYQQNNEGFAKYIVAHPKTGGGVFATLGKASGQVTKTLDKIPGFTKVTTTLDKYVPGYTIFLNFLIPGGGILGALSAVTGVAGKIPLIGNVLSAASFITGGAQTYGSFASTAGGFASSGFSSGIVTGFGPAANAQWALENTPLKLVNTFPLSTARVTNIFLTTHGSVLEKIGAASLEAVSEVALALQAAVLVLTLGTTTGLVAAAEGAIAVAQAAANAALLESISTATQALKGTIIAAQSGDPYAIATAAASTAAALVGLGGVAGNFAAGSAQAAVVEAAKYALSSAKVGISVVKTAALAKQVKKASDLAVRNAMNEAAELDTQTKALETQIAQLKVQQANILAQRAAAQKAAPQKTAVQKTPAQKAAAQKAAASREIPLISPVSRSLGVSNETLIVGGVVLAILVVGAVVVMGGEED